MHNRFFAYSWVISFLCSKKENEVFFAFSILPYLLEIMRSGYRLHLQDKGVEGSRGEVEEDTSFGGHDQLYRLDLSFKERQGARRLVEENAWCYHIA